MLSQFTGQKETDSSLDLPRGDGGSLVVVGETGSLSCDSLEDIVDKTVHDRHGFAADSGVGVNLLQHFVDVDAVAFLPPALPLLVSDTGGLRLPGLLCAFRADFRWHVRRIWKIERELRPLSLSGIHRGRGDCKGGRVDARY